MSPLGPKALQRHIGYTGGIWGFPKIRGTFLGGLNIKDYSIWGCILGTPYLEKLPYRIPGLRAHARRPWFSSLECRFHGNPHGQNSGESDGQKNTSLGLPVT